MVEVTFNPDPSSGNAAVPPGCTGLFANGISANGNGLVDNSFSGMNFDRGGTQSIAQTITDLTTGSTFSFHHESIDIPALVGGGSAYVGFTHVSGNYDILSWTYTSPAVGSTPFAPSFLHLARYTDPFRNDLVWTDNSTNEDSFVVERSVQGGPWSVLAALPANTTSYKDSDLTQFVDVRYAVRAVNGSGSSIQSNIVGTNPQGHRLLAPADAAATAVSPNQVNLTWQDSNLGSGASFRIYRRVGGTGDFTVLALVATDNHHTAYSFTDTQAPSGSLLEYRIVSTQWVSDYTHDGESDPASASTTTPAAPADVFGPKVQLNGTAQRVGSALQLTDDRPIAEAGSAISTLRQSVDHFTTQFTFQIVKPSVGGFTFSMVGTPAHLGSPAGLGFGDGQNTGDVALSVDFTLGNPFETGSGATGVMNNTFPRVGSSIDLTPFGIDFRSGHVFSVTLSNRGRIAVDKNPLDETIVDTSTGATFSHTYWVGMSNVLDYVGLTAGKPASSQQGVNILSWSFTTDASPNPTVFITPPAPTDQNAQGLVWTDFNNDGAVDFGEGGIAGVPITLSNSDGFTAQTTTDSNGLYTFNHVPVGVYTIAEGAVPPGYVQGRDSLGSITDLSGNVISASAGDNSVQDVFSDIHIAANQNAINYNFGEQPAPGASVTRGQAATIGFWQNKNGQALINQFSSIGSWLAATLPNSFSALTNASPQQVGTLYQQNFVLKDKLDVQLMATALNAYASSASLGGTAGGRYGFTVTQYGLANSTWNVGSNGAAFGVANNSTLTVLQLLQDADNHNILGINDPTLRKMEAHPLARMGIGCLRTT